MIPKYHEHLNDSGERLPIYSEADEDLAQKANKFAQRIRHFRCALKSQQCAEIPHHELRTTMCRTFCWRSSDCFDEALVVQQALTPA
jgi:hypothetical protein